MLLEVNDITKFYPGQNEPVLDGITFSVDKGERVGIVGESGSGKTTLSRIIAGLEPADDGSVAFNGARIDFGEGEAVPRRIRDRQVRAAWLGMQMVFQNPAASFSDHMDIGKAIWEGAAYNADLRHCDKRDRRDLIANSLESVGLDSSFMKRRAFELSGGECQRAAIARAIIGDPKLIICDEATSALDVTVQAHIMDLLERLYEEKGMAFIFVSHNIALVQGFCDKIYSVSSPSD